MRLRSLNGGMVLTVCALLAACSGGGSDDSGASNSPSQPAQQNQQWKYTGSAPQVTGVNGQVSVLLMPATLTAGVFPNSAFVGSGPLASQVQQASYGGAFTTLGSASSTYSLTPGGTIADINGAGGYVAIGRWTAGSDTMGGNYTANQGAVYAVGNPLTLPAGTGTQSCTNLMATSPTSPSGNVAPGQLVSASATLDLSTQTLNNLALAVTIGQDSNAPISIPLVTLKNGLTMTGGYTYATAVIGNDPTKPLVAISYAAKVPNTGNVNGLVVLSCS